MPTDTLSAVTLRNPCNISKMTNPDNSTNPDSKTDDAIQKRRELEALFGIQATNPFGTTDYAILEENLAKMTYDQLVKLAIKLNVGTRQSPTRIIEKIKKEFLAQFGQNASLGDNTGVNTYLQGRSQKDLEEIQDMMHINQKSKYLDR